MTREELLALISKIQSYQSELDDVEIKPADVRCNMGKNLRVSL